MSAAALLKGEMYVLTDGEWLLHYVKLTPSRLQLLNNENRVDLESELDLTSFRLALPDHTGDAKRFTIISKDTSADLRAATSSVSSLWVSRLRAHEGFDGAFKLNAATMQMDRPPSPTNSNTLGASSSESEFVEEDDMPKAKVMCFVLAYGIGEALRREVSHNNVLLPEPMDTLSSPSLKTNSLFKNKVTSTGFAVEACEESPVDATAYDVLVSSKHSAAGTDFAFEDYAPSAFEWVRGRFGFAPHDYFDSMAAVPLTGGGQGEGKSGMLFFRSADERCVVKTITSAELALLVRYLPAYTAHVAANPDTLLPRFFGLHRIKIKGSTMTVVVMNNVFSTAVRLHEVYDVKGSTYGREVKEGDASAADSDSSDNVEVLKDLNLKRKLYLGSERYSFLEQINADVKWLSERELMDYSLLIGVHICPLTTVNPLFHLEHNMTEDEFRDAELRMRAVPYLYQSKWQREEGGFRAQPCAAVADDVSSDDGTANGASAGETSSDSDSGGPEDDGHDDVIYFFGIIDILQEYNVKKKLERGIKSVMVNDSATLSVIEADAYGMRFKGFCESITMGDN